MKILPIASVALLVAVSACQRREEPAEAPAPAVAVAPPAPEPLDPQTLQTLAFRTAWGAAGPIRRDVTAPGLGKTRITYAAGQLVPLGGDLYALVSDGQGDDAHVSAGAVAIHYLKRTADGFAAAGAWPEFVYGGTFGAPPQWTLRTDLTPAPALVTTGGGTWQGYTCASSDLIELTPTKPVLRAEGIPVTYDSSGAAFEASDAKAMDGALAPSDKGRSFQVRYTGDRTATVTYALRGETYAATSKPDLLTC